MKKILIILIALTVFEYAKSQSNMYKLVLHSKQRGAMCLDGSPAGMYIHEGTGVNKTKYLIYFYGGGFCGEKTAQQTLDSCYFRSFTLLGTTTVYKKLQSFDGQGIVSTIPSENPSFHDWTKIVAIYCDGACHQGYRQKPVFHIDKDLYFRGSRNVMQHFRYLDQNYDFYNGDTIVVTGLSAGGMAVYQWSNYVYEHAKTAKVYAIPDSGFFMTDYFSSFAKGRILGQKIQNLINLLKTQDLSSAQFAGPVKACLDQVGLDGSIVSCLDASNYAKNLKPPMFIIESPIDQWCLKYIVGIKCMSNRRSPLSLSKCNDSSVAAIQKYQKDVIRRLKHIKGNRQDVGGWGPVCVQHGFLSFPNPSSLSDNYRIPTTTGIKLHDAISQFLKNPSKAKWYLQQENWPSNRGCSGLASNIRNAVQLNN